ncbi:MAG: electron transfer flavoprotein-ubiquinone oxidoreductase [Gammaproteobacteria bacterium]|nr:electron transfer flavoprotein-ubiquinone oxidoreductase [Gammaproteobacteria bacterium]
MDFDIVIVGAGPAGLSTAIHLKQLANAASQELEICLIEKGAEVGAHILSGAVFEPRALDELIPEWQTMDLPVTTKVVRDELSLIMSATKAQLIPSWAAPKTMHNKGNYIISLSNLCKWLGEYAENLGINVFSGFAGAEILYDNDGIVYGVATGDMGVGLNGEQKNGYEPGIELHAKYTVFAEGCRGHLGKELIDKFNLDADKDPQHYGIGIKEVWEVPTEQHQPGLVIHTAGWPLAESKSAGGGFLYHFGENLISIGLITDLSYSNPHVSPFEEMQRYKTHPLINKHLLGGKRIGYGARAITKGGIQSLPQMYFSGGLLIGDDAGTLNFAKIKGAHTAMKSGMVAAEVLLQALLDGRERDELCEYEVEYKKSWAYEELYFQRNFGPAQHKWGNLLGSAYAFWDINIFNGKVPWTLKDPKPDYTTLKKASDSKVINYPKPDGKLTFDRLSSVYLSSIYHEEDQPVHLQLTDNDKPIIYNLAEFNEPAQRYCPAGVYEIVNDDRGGMCLQINAQNCVHCKTCDIKDPAQNITWVVPEGGAGPNYSNM